MLPASARQMQSSLATLTSRPDCGGFSCRTCGRAGLEAIGRPVKRAFAVLQPSPSSVPPSLPAAQKTHRIHVTVLPSLEGPRACVSVSGELLSFLHQNHRTQGFQH